jgi:carbon storage regulator
MLVLSRKRNEVICIGDTIRITVVDIDQGKIRLGIEAPKDVPVDRLEVREEKERARQQDHAGATGTLDCAR